MLLVVALGGNALLERGERPDAGVQQRHVRTAAHALAPLAARHTLVLCHGNGPQVGVLALESEHDPELTRPFPLDALGAQTQGMIGYWLAQEMGNAGVVAPVVALVTQTVVDPEDPAFGTPTKFVGGGYPEQEARRLAAEHGWTVAKDTAGWRRVVASPPPLQVRELPTIRRLVASGTTVICGGGGGVPVGAGEHGWMEGVQAVVDKDLTAALLAIQLGADRLIVLTDVDAVKQDFGTRRERSLATVDVADLRTMDFPAGSMAPKAEACLRFVTATGRPAAIGTLISGLANCRASTAHAEGPRCRVGRFGPCSASRCAASSALSPCCWLDSRTRTASLLKAYQPRGSVPRSSTATGSESAISPSPSRRLIGVGAPFDRPYD